jgi:hypothetical protein
MMTHCQTAGRKVHLVNLDPAAEHFEYDPTIGTVKQNTRFFLNKKN